MKVHPEIVLIAAVARNGVIGRDNGLPWTLKADMRRFKSLTTGHPIVMGRKTWDSLGRPLPNRRNLVVTRSTGYQAPGAEVFPAIDAALAAAGDAPRLFVIGGADIYRQTLAKADLLLLTEIGAEVEGDAYFPTFSTEGFKETWRESFPADDENNYPYDFVEYRKAGY